MLKKQHLIYPLSIIALSIATPALAEPTLGDFLPYQPTPQQSNPQSIIIDIPEPEPIQPTQNNNACNAFLAPAIEEIIRRYGGGWGILVQKLSDGEVIYHYNADRPFIPASNMKLLTTAAALQRISPGTNISANKSLNEWVRVTNLSSNNHYADTLLKRIGGSATARQILTEMGVNPTGLAFADGSGLSRNNQATPRVLVDTLRVMYNNPHRDIFMTSLPTAGISGTLRNRMKQTPVQGIVHAKTGTLRGVRALSGYLDHREYGTLIFSILANAPNQSGTALVRAIDEIVITLNTTSNCQQVNNF